MRTLLAAAIVLATSFGATAAGLSSSEETVVSADYNNLAMGDKKKKKKDKKKKKGKGRAPR